jgi:DNA polymerase III epsilon subunit-like protein
VKLSDLSENLKGRPIDSLSKGLLDALSRIKSRISATSVLKYATGVTSENPIFLAYDTETTGLNHGIKKDKETGMTYPDYKSISKRDIIIELAAIAYDKNFHPVVFDEKLRHGDLPEEGGFHAKITPKALKYKSEEYFMNRLKVLGFNLADLGKMEEIYNKHKKGFKIDLPNFELDIQNSLMTDANKAKELAKLLSDHFTIKGLKDMNKYDKNDFEKIHTEGEYAVHRYEEEFQLVKHFIDFAEKFNEDGEVYIVAQNLPYDAGMVESCLHYISKYGKGDEREEAEQYLDKWDNLMRNSFDTKDLFKKVVNKKKVLNEIQKYFPENGIKIIDMINKMNPEMKEDAGSGYRGMRKGERSLSLGKLAPKMMNKAWHTAMNDVYVTVEAARYYASLVKLLAQMKRVIQGKPSKYILDKELIRYLRSSN